jgi:hypothetical protein
MDTLRKYLLSALILIALLGAGFHQALALDLQPTIPPGFHLVKSAFGVEFFRKDYPDGSPDFVQRVSLSQGASIKLLHGAIANPRSGKGVYGGDDPSIVMRPLQEFWKDFLGAHSTAFCITNGQFFYLQESPTRLPFPLKTDGKIVSDGYGIKEFPGQKLMLEIWPDRADIHELTKEALYTSSAPDIVAGLSEEAKKRIDKYVGRTFIGVADQDGDSSFETILIFNTQSARQDDAAGVLRSFGAKKVMMLDGGSSTQLICRDQAYITTDRPIPQAIGIMAASVPPFYAQVAGQTGPSVLEIGESFRTEIALKNGGSSVWENEDTFLVIEGESPGTVERVALEKDTASGEVAVFTWRTNPMLKSGVFTIHARLVEGKSRSTADLLSFQLIVIPAELASQRSILEEQLKIWEAQPSAAIDRLAEDWIQSHLALLPPSALAQQSPVQIGDDSDSTPGMAIVWIITVALPLGALCFLALRRRRKSA